MISNPTADSMTAARRCGSIMRSNPSADALTAARGCGSTAGRPRRIMSNRRSTTAKMTMMEVAAIETAMGHGIRSGNIAIVIAIVASGFEMVG